MTQVITAPAWLRSDAVKSAIEKDLCQQKKSLSKERDAVQVLVDSQSIQDGYGSFQILVQSS